MAEPNSSELKLMHAAALVSAGKLEDARTEVALLAAEPSNTKALAMAADLSRLAGDDEARRSFLDKALASSSQDPGVLTSWGQYYLDTKNWAMAEDFFRRALAVDAQNPDATLGLGQALFRESRFAEAETTLGEAIALDPTSPIAYDDRSRVRYQLGKVAEAGADLDRAVANAPDSAWMHLDRGRFLLDQSKRDLAIQDFSKAIELEPNYFLSYVYRAGIREEMGRDDLAILDYRKVISIYPEYWYAFDSAGAVAFRLGLWSESANDFGIAFQKSPSRYEYAIASAIALWRAGKAKDASTYAGGIAPTIDREKDGIYWAMLRLLQDQNDVSADLELKIQAETQLDLKAAMLFYLGEYWLCRDRPEIARACFGKSEDLQRRETLEYRLLQVELRHMGPPPSNG